jgi:hypothetical protein
VPFGRRWSARLTPTGRIASQCPTKSDYRDDDAERAGMRNPIALYMLTMREFKKIPNRSGEQSLKLTTVHSRVEDGSTDCWGHLGLASLGRSAIAELAGPALEFPSVIERMMLPKFLGRFKAE